MRAVVFVSVVLVILGCWCTSRADEKRVALVIGNATYGDTGKLSNTVNDAEAVAEKLRSLGFIVTLATDLDRRKAIVALDEFGRNLPGADLALFYYAGHGIQIGNRNFLLPVDVDVSSERALRYSAIDIHEVVAEMERRAKVAVVVLDACRDNPFVEVLTASAGAGRSIDVSRGLGPIDLASRGAIIAYAASAGEVASDGIGDHSPYTSALLQEIDSRGVEVGLMFRRVAGRVIDATNGVQRPELLVRLVDEVYLNPSSVVDSVEKPEDPGATEPPKVDTEPEDDQDPIDVAIADIGDGQAANGRSTRSGEFFGNHVIRKPAWAEAPALPEPIDWRPKEAARVSEIDANDSYGSAQPIELNSVVTIRITPRGDADWFKFEVPIAGELAVVAAKTPAELDLQARVWNGELAVVADWQRAPRAGGVLDGRYQLPGPGTYWVELSDSRSDKESAETIEVSLEFTPAKDWHEPNNNQLSAGIVPIDTSFKPTIFPRGDHDWYRVWISSPGLLSVSATEVPDDLDIVVRLWNLDGTVVRDWAKPPRKGGDTYFDAELKLPGVYLIEVADGRDDSSVTEPFDLAVEFQPVDDISEPNNSFGEAAAGKASRSGRVAIFPRGDHDWLAIDVDHPGQLAFLATNIPEEIDLQLRAWSSDKEVIRDWVKPYRKGGDLEGFVDFPRPGRYILQIADGRDDASGVKLFDLELTYTAQMDQYEPNNSMAAATPHATGNEIAINILPRGDHDWFRIDVPSQGELLATIDEGPDNLDFNFRVWNANRQVIQDWVKPYRKGGLTEGFVDFPNAGIYFLEVADGRDDQRAIEPAILKTKFTPTNDEAEPNNSFGQAKPFPAGVDANATILPRGDHDWYELRAPRPGAFLVTITDVAKSLDIHVRLWNSEGQASGWIGPPRKGGVTDAELPVDRAGVYRLEIADGRDDERSPQPFRVSVEFQ